MSPVCEIDALSHRNGVHDISLSIERGEVVALVGPSGAGKTTLARCVLGLEPPDAGTVRLEGQPWSSLRESERRPRRRHYQYLPQDATSALDPQQTVREHLAETLTVLAGEPASAADRLLVQLGLEHRADALPRALSPGEQRRVTVARVLALRPRFVVADEPTSGLDPDRREAVIAALLEARHPSAAVLWVTHELDLAMRWATRLVGLVDGRIVDDVPLPGGRPAHPWVLRAMMPNRSGGA